MIFFVCNELGHSYCSPTCLSFRMCGTRKIPGNVAIVNLSACVDRFLSKKIDDLHNDFYTALDVKLCHEKQIIVIV